LLQFSLNDFLKKILIVSSLTLTLSACGGGGGGGDQSPNSTPVNQIPTANAGTDQTIDETTTVLLNGSGADPDGNITDYSWTQISGTSVTLSNTDEASASFTAPDISTDEKLVFELAVTDNDGAKASDEISISVSNVNQMPTAIAGTDQTIDETTTVLLNGSGTDPDGSITDYSWTQISGTSVTLNNADEASASFTAPDISADEKLVFELAVTDNDGAKASDEISISVSNIYIPIVRGNSSSFAAIRSDGSVATWGVESSGGDNTYKGDAYLDVKAITSTSLAYAAINTDGTVITWGDAYYGGDSSSIANKLDNVQNIVASGGAFAALKADGTVITWGDAYSGGDSSSVIDELINVQTVTSNPYAFAALNNDGTVVTWGHISFGGNSSNAFAYLHDVIDISASDRAFAALKSDGTVITWGDASHGGDSSRVTSLLTNVDSIVGNSNSFIAIRKDGSIVKWCCKYGDDGVVSSISDIKKLTPIGSKFVVEDDIGNVTAFRTGNNVSQTIYDTGIKNVVSIKSTNVGFIALKSDKTVQQYAFSPFNITYPLPANLVDIVSISSNGHAFAAITSKGKIITWGSSYRGGDIDVSLADKLKNSIDFKSAGPEDIAALKEDGTVIFMYNGGSASDKEGVTGSLTDIANIISTTNAFTALASDGSVTSWGSDYSGGSTNLVRSDLFNVDKVIANNAAFSALKSDGTVVSWGNDLYGGNTSSIFNSLVDIKEIYSSSNSFAALKDDGSIMTWGDEQTSNITNVTGLSNIVSIAGADYAYAALKADGTVITWGDANYGGDSSSVTDELKNINEVIAGNYFFAAIKDDTSVVTWGMIDEQDVSLIGVQSITTSDRSFAALKADGSVKTWGYGIQADSSTVSEYLVDVKSIVANEYAYVALKNDGKIVVWGEDSYGGRFESVKDLTNIVEVFPVAFGFFARKSDGTVFSWGRVESLMPVEIY
jgi:alpha-tubulin suppressor-like RCC1 family protein